MSQFLINKPDRQSVQQISFNISLRGTDSNMTSNFGAKQENDRFSSIMGGLPQFNTIMLSQIGNDKSVDQKEIKQAIDVLQQSMNDRRVTMQNVEGPEQMNQISLDLNADKILKEEDSNNQSESHSSEVFKSTQKDQIY